MQHLTHSPEHRAWERQDPLAVQTGWEEKVWQYLIRVEEEKLLGIGQPRLGGTTVES